MSLKICGHLFYGPFDVEKTIIRPNRPLIYTLVCRQGEPWDPVFRLIDVGHSGPEVLSLVEHPKFAEWRTVSSDKDALGVYLFDTPADQGFTDQSRAELTQRIRAELDPPNGIIPIFAI